MKTTKKRIISFILITVILIVVTLIIINVGEIAQGFRDARTLR